MMYPRKKKKKQIWFSLDVQQWRLFWEQKHFEDTHRHTQLQGTRESTGNSMNKTHLQFFSTKISSLPPSHSSLLHPLPIIPSKTVYRFLSLSDYMASTNNPTMRRTMCFKKPLPFTRILVKLTPAGGFWGGVCHSSVFVFREKLCVLLVG